MRYIFALFFIVSIGFSVLAIASERKAAEILCERTNKKLQFETNNSPENQTDKYTKHGDE